MLCGFALGLTDGLFFQKDHFAPQMGAGERGKTPAFAEASSFASPFATGRLRRTRWRAGEILKKILSYLDADDADDLDKRKDHFKTLCGIPLRRKISELILTPKGLPHWS